MVFDQVTCSIILFFFSPIIIFLLGANIVIWFENGRIFKELGYKCPNCSGSKLLGHVNNFLPFGDDPFNTRIGILCLNLKCLKYWTLNWTTAIEQAFRERGTKLFDGPR